MTVLVKNNSLNGKKCLWLCFQSARPCLTSMDCHLMTVDEAEAYIDPDQYPWEILDMAFPLTQQDIPNWARPSSRTQPAAQPADQRWYQPAAQPAVVPATQPADLLALQQQVQSLTNRIEAAHSRITAVSDTMLTSVARRLQRLEQAAGVSPPPPEVSPPAGPPPSAPSPPPPGLGHDQPSSVAFQHVS